MTKKRRASEKGESTVVSQTVENVNEILENVDETVESADGTVENTDETVEDVEDNADDEKKPAVTDFVASNVLLKMRKQAASALEVFREMKKRSEKMSLFPEVDDLVNITCVYKKPATRNADVLQKKIVVPHALLDERTTTVCLIMPDFDRSEKALRDADVDKQARIWMDALVGDYGITSRDVHKVITLRQLEREYPTYNDKRQLASAYDLFIVDSAVEKICMSHCGKEFYKAHKMPLSVNIKKKELGEEISRARHTILLPLSANRTRTSLRVGNLSHESEKLLDNIQEAIARLFDYCPGGMLNVRSLYMQISSGGPSLPIYADAGSANEVQLPKAKRNGKRKGFALEEGELSTLPDGLSVKIRPDGKVRVIDSETKKAMLYPTVNDEWEERDDLKPKIDPEKIALEKEKKKAAILNREQREVKRKKKALKGEIKKIKKIYANVGASSMSKAAKKDEELEKKKTARLAKKREQNKKRRARAMTDTPSSASGADALPSSTPQTEARTTELNKAKEKVRLENFTEACPVSPASSGANTDSAVRKRKKMKKERRIGEVTNVVSTDRTVTDGDWQSEGLKKKKLKKKVHVGEVVTTSSTPLSLVKASGKRAGVAKGERKNPSRGT